MGVLLKGYDFATVQEYYEYIGESFINGQGQQAKNLFLEMPKSYQIRLLTWQDGLRFQLTERDQVKLTAWAIDANFDTYLLNI